jgi:hypothetical protein
VAGEDVLLREHLADLGVNDVLDVLLLQRVVQVNVAVVVLGVRVGTVELRARWNREPRATALLVAGVLLSVKETDKILQDGVVGQLLHFEHEQFLFRNGLQHRNRMCCVEPSHCPERVNGHTVRGQCRSFETQLWSVLLLWELISAYSRFWRSKFQSEHLAKHFGGIWHLVEHTGGPLERVACLCHEFGIREGFHHLGQDV